jgi:6-phosphogluconate dehydrogenase
MTIGMIGLGRMGANMTKRLLAGGHRVVAYDQDPGVLAAAHADGAAVTGSLPDLVAALEPPRAVWVMVPSGDATNETIAALGDLLSAGDVVIDGGNSHYRSAQRWAATLEGRGIDLLDAGVSGGVWGLEVGYCLMVGGRAAPVTRLEPVFTTLAPQDG